MKMISLLVFENSCVRELFEKKFTGGICDLGGPGHVLLDTLYVIDRRRGRAEAREHAGDIPTCPGTKIGRIPKISFPATFPSLPLNGLRLAHLA